jgi:hypothetical protein
VYDSKKVSPKEKKEQNPTNKRSMGAKRNGRGKKIKRKIGKEKERKSISTDR